MASSGKEISSAGADVVYVAVEKDVSKSKKNLLYALQNWKGARFYIIHVVEPAVKNFVGIQWWKKQKADMILDDYLLLCRRQKVDAEKLVIESDSVEMGILELISHNEIRKLVMGAAADKHYSSRMVDLKSKKAIYVFRNAPASCDIQFVCRGHLIKTNRGYVDFKTFLDENWSMARIATVANSCDSSRKIRYDWPNTTNMQAQVSGSLHAEDFRQRDEEVIEELGIAQNEKSSLEEKTSEYDGKRDDQAETSSLRHGTATDLLAEKGKWEEV